MPPGPYRAGGWRGRSAHEADPALGAKPPALGASRTVAAGSAAGPASLPANRAAASAPAASLRSSPTRATRRTSRPSSPRPSTRHSDIPTVPSDRGAGMAKS